MHVEAGLRLAGTGQSRVPTKTSQSPCTSGFRPALRFLNAKRPAEGRIGKSGLLRISIQFYVWAAV
jgi:hypothetical protein